MPSSVEREEDMPFTGHQTQASGFHLLKSDVLDRLKRVICKWKRERETIIRIFEDLNVEQKKEKMKETNKRLISQKENQKSIAVQSTFWVEGQITVIACHSPCYSHPATHFLITWVLVVPLFPSAVTVFPSSLP